MADKPPIDVSKILPKDITLDEIKRRAAPDMGPLGKDDGEPVSQGESQMVLFEGITIRKMFHENEWHFAITDIVAALTGTDRPSKYWADLKAKLLKEEGFIELSDKIGQLRLPAADGKLYLMDTVTVETALRIIQSIPSRKAEPFKRWLATVGYERIQEIQDPEIAVKRAILMWQAQGRTSDWIEARLRCIVVRRELTDRWQKGGITGSEYGRLTNIISQHTFDLDTSQHRQLKGLSPKHNLRDHMTDLELVFTMLGEKSTTAIAQASNAEGLDQNIAAAKSGGRVAGDARRNLERQLKSSIVSRANFLEESRKKDPERLTATSPKERKRKLVKE